MAIGGVYAYTAFGRSFANQLTKESWSFYAVVVFVIGVRTYARVRKMGFRGLEVDDYLMYLAFLFYTMTIVCLNLLASGSGSALAIPGFDPATFPPDLIAADELGAKIGLLAEQGMLNTIWVLKGCMLLLYNRLTLSTNNHWKIKALAAYCVVGYIAIQMTFFLECRPFKQYWQVNPPADNNCMVLFTYAAVQMPFNISSDLLIMAIPLPMIWSLKISGRQKLALIPIFSLGLFVIAAALATKIEFWISIYDANFMFWYTREASIAMYVANLPCIWPLLREKFAFLRGTTREGSSRPYGRTTGVTGAQSGVKSFAAQTHLDTQIAHEDDDMGIGAAGKEGIHTQRVVEIVTTSAEHDLEKGF